MTSTDNTSKITPSDLVKALEEHTELTYTDYEYDGDEEISVERIRNVIALLDDIDNAVKRAKDAEKKYLDEYAKLVSDGIKAGEITVAEKIEVPSGTTLQLNQLVILTQLKADGTLSMGVSS